MTTTNVQPNVIRWRRCALEIADMHAATADDEAVERKPSKRNRDRLLNECQEALSMLSGDIHSGPVTAFDIGKEQAVVGRIERAQRALYGDIVSVNTSKRRPGTFDADDRHYLEGESISNLMLWHSYWRSVTFRLAEFVAASIEEVAGKKSVSKDRCERLNLVAARTKALINSENEPLQNNIQSVRDRFERTMREIQEEAPTPQQAKPMA